MKKHFINYLILANLVVFSWHNGHYHGLTKADDDTFQVYTENMKKAHVVKHTKASVPHYKHSVFAALEK